MQNIHLIAEATNETTVEVRSVRGCLSATASAYSFNMTRDELLIALTSIDWDIHDSYGQAYMKYEDEVRYENLISLGRREKTITIDEVGLFKAIASNSRKHRKELEAWIYNAPRREAQSFIGKKNIRAWVFKRDGYKCLRCGSVERLTIDHITAINKGGKNKLSNLQTLCASCNSSKSDKYADYR